jgi:UDP-2,3-diacylglucosamine hydrolase
MPQPGCAYFIADAHLGQGSDDSNRARERDLLAFFDRVASERASLYVNGDLFDFWFEYGHAIPKRFVRVLQALGELRRRGILVTYVGGNHDFWIGNYLERELGVSFTDQAMTLKLQGRTIFLAHGDGLGPGDGGYKVLKRILRNGIARGVFRWIHPDVGIPLATALSRASRHHAPRAAQTEAALVERLAKPWLNRGHDAVVMGHFHRPLHYRGADGEFLILGDWLERRSYARLQDGQFSLMEFENGRSAGTTPAGTGG